MFTEAGAPAAPVAEVAAEVNAVPDHGDGPQLGGNTSIWKDRALVHRQLAETCWGQRSPMPPGAARSLRGTIAKLCHAAMLRLRAFGFGHSMAKATAHAEGQRSPAQVAAEEKGQAGNREGTSQRPLMMRRGAMLAGSGCG